MKCLICGRFLPKHRLFSHWCDKHRVDESELNRLFEKHPEIKDETLAEIKHWLQ